MDEINKHFEEQERAKDLIKEYRDICERRTLNTGDIVQLMITHKNYENMIKDEEKSNSALHNFMGWISNWTR